MDAFPRWRRVLSMPNGSVVVLYRIWSAWVLGGSFRVVETDLRALSEAAAPRRGRRPFWLPCDDGEAYAIASVGPVRFTGPEDGVLVEVDLIRRVLHVPLRRMG
ncbi:hypothetical protein WME76_02070 [Sorangium sp. So ce119]|uniref:hypothetical protein n=1 Tax=Sorangium sp. So ce119 TaxID=3133279 RepID=UPI003F6157EB